MLLLILTVCSLSAPERCNEARIQVAESITPGQCLMQAQPTIAQWAGEHPGERVTRWRCDYAEREGAGI